MFYACSTWVFKVQVKVSLPSADSTVVFVSTQYLQPSLLCTFIAIRMTVWKMVFISTEASDFRNLS